MTKLYALDFRQVVADNAHEFPEPFLKTMEQAKGLFGLYYEDFMRTEGHIHNIIVEYNQLADETVDEYLTRLMEMYRSEILAAWEFTPKAIELINGATHGYFEED